MDMDAPLDFELHDPLCSTRVRTAGRSDSMENLWADHLKQKSELIEREAKRAKMEICNSDEDHHGKAESSKQESELIESESELAKKEETYTSGDDDDDDDEEESTKHAEVSRLIDELQQQLEQVSGEGEIYSASELRKLSSRS